MKDEDVQPVPAEQCRPERCGEYIIINEQGVPNTDGECQKKKPVDAWYAMQDQGLCRRSPLTSKDHCWCVVPKCKPVQCGTQAFNEMVNAKESRCYSEKQDDMTCQQSEKLCKEIKSPFNGSK